LGLDDDHPFAFGQEMLSDFPGRLGGVTNLARRHGDAALREQLFGLEFV
jgi:hypothetical protein